MASMPFGPFALLSALKKSTLYKLLLTEEFWVDCGATHVSEAQVQSLLTPRLPTLKDEISHMKFGEINKYVMFCR